jgi:hypothetical protein
MSLPLLVSLVLSELKQKNISKHCVTFDATLGKHCTIDNYELGRDNEANNARSYLQNA